MIKKTRSSTGQTCAALLVVVVLLTIVPVGLTRHSAGESIQKTTKPEKESSNKYSGDLFPWSLQSIGNARDGAARRRPPEIQLRGMSEGYGTTRDSLHFLSQESDGNFDLSARLDAIQDSGLGGLMVRLPGNYGSEPYFRVTAHRTSDGRAQLRTVYKSDPQKAAYESRDLATVVALPVYLKLRRVGSVYSSSFSSDGREYRDLLRIDSKGTRLAGRELDVGMVQSSENAKVAGSVVFKALQLQSTEPRVSELVSVGVKEPLVGGVPTSGAIVRSNPVGLSSGGEVVAYLKSDSTFLKVPARLVFASGKNTASFEVLSESVNKPTPANLTVVLNGQKKNVKVTILPQGAVGSVSVRPDQFFNRDPRAVVKVDLVHPAPIGGTRVLVSPSSQQIRTPSVVIVPAGERSVQFDVSGPGIVSGNSFVTVTSGRVSRDIVVDLNNLVLADGSVLDCPLFPITPRIATDGQRVYLNGVVEEGARVFLSGFRYNDAPPTRRFPGGEGQERVFCGCQRVSLEAFLDPDGGVHTRPYFLVPMNAPSGDYSVEVRSERGDCPAGGVKSDVCPGDLCSASHNLFVAPSYMVTSLNKMNINANTEDGIDHPAEMSFAFSSLSGTPARDGENAVALVNFSGIYPGGVKGSGHLTNADETVVFPQIPLYIGSEYKMINIDCREECSSLPAGREAECLSICQDLVARGRFSDHFEFTFGGAEFDSSPSKWWGYIGGAGAAALGCFLSFKVGHPKEGCKASGDLGIATANVINDALKDDDDKLGTFSRANNHTLGGFEWGSPAEEGPFKLAGDRDGGNIDLFLQNHRVGGPQILQYSVKLKSLTVVAGYEEASCEEPNEVFLHSRAFLSQGGPLIDTTRFPSASGVWSLNTGETEDFGGTPLVLGQQTFRPEAAAESPLLYVEIGVWENDDEKDLMGLHSQTFFLADLLSTNFNEIVDDITPEGLFVRRAKLRYFAPLHGYSGSDNHCYGIWAVAGDPNAEKSRVNVEYEIEVTWLKRTRR